MTERDAESDSCVICGDEAYQFYCDKHRDEIEKEIDDDSVHVHMCSIFDNMGRWEDYVDMELENGTPLDEIYTTFYWENGQISYGGWLLNNAREVDTEL